jgi:hypothetical protein
MGTPPDVERRFAAILAADAKGYSRLMGEDEVGTAAALGRAAAITRIAASPPVAPSGPGSVSPCQAI